MINGKKIEKALKYAIATFTCIVIMLVFMSLIAAEVAKKPQAERQEIFTKQKEVIEKIAAARVPNENLPDIWPPKMNETYPDLELFDQKGQEFKISDFAGKILVIEYIDMSSPISQAQSGANLKGAFGIMQEVDQFAQEFHDVIAQTAQTKISWPNDNVVQIKIIAYTQDGSQATRDSAQNWAEHFGFTKENNVYVGITKKDIRNVKTQDILTGYQLVDANQKLRVDSAGPAPKHNLKLTLVPLFEDLLRLQ